MKFTEVYRHEDELLAEGMDQVTATLKWNKDLRWAQREIGILRGRGVECEIGILNQTTDGKKTCAIFRDRKYLKRYKSRGEGGEA